MTCVVFIGIKCINIINKRLRQYYVINALHKHSAMCCVPVD